MSRTVRRCGLYLGLLSLGLTLSCAISAGVGPGGSFVEFTILGRTFTLSFGAVPPIRTEAGTPTNPVPVDFSDAFAGVPRQTPSAGTMKFPSTSVVFGEPRPTTEKGTVRSQALRLRVFTTAWSSFGFAEWTCAVRE